MPSPLHQIALECELIAEWQMIRHHDINDSCTRLCEMNTADFNELSESEKRHFYKCRCGEMVDKRQLDDVLFHETDHKPRPDIQYGGSVRVVDSAS